MGGTTFVTNRRNTILFMITLHSADNMKIQRHLLKEQLDRKSVEEGKGVDRGGRWNIKVISVC